MRNSVESVYRIGRQYRNLRAEFLAQLLRIDRECLCKMQRAIDGDMTAAERVDGAPAAQLAAMLVVAAQSDGEWYT